MNVVATFVRRYPIVAITLLVAIVGGTIELFGYGAIAQWHTARWIISAFAVAVAAMQARDMLRNLLDNAVRYTPEGGDVTASVETFGQAVILRITDGGPGISSGLQQRVFDRFYRVAGSGQQGCGLGLSIVLRIAELHGGTVNFEGGAGKGTFAVIVTLPIVDRMKLSI